jgi:type II secretory pathway component PulF
VRRLRLLGVVLIVLVVVAPSVVEMFRQDLSPVTVLLRLVLALLVVGALAWTISALVLHYARVQTLARERATDRADD